MKNLVDNTWFIVLVIIALVFFFIDKPTIIYDAIIYEIDSAPQPTQEDLWMWCKEGMQGACDKYYENQIKK